MIRRRFRERIADEWTFSTWSARSSVPSSRNIDIGILIRNARARAQGKFVESRDLANGAFAGLNYYRKKPGCVCCAREKEFARGRENSDDNRARCRTFPVAFNYSHAFGRLNRLLIVSLVKRNYERRLR